MFRGITAINIDSKGRLMVPTRYREKLQQDCDGRMVLTIDTEASCLLLYPMHAWEAIEEKLQRLPSFNPAARRIQRLLIGHATEIELDANGRILIPALLREYAALDKTTMLVGQGNKFELWSEGNWIDGRHRWLAEEADRDAELPDELKALSL